MQKIIWLYFQEDLILKCSQVQSNPGVIIKKYKRAPLFFGFYCLFINKFSENFSLGISCFIPPPPTYLRASRSKITKKGKQQQRKKVCFVYNFVSTQTFSVFFKLPFSVAFPLWYSQALVRHICVSLIFI